MGTAKAKAKVVETRIKDRAIKILRGSSNEREIRTKEKENEKGKGKRPDGNEITKDNHGMEQKKPKFNGKGGFQKKSWFDRYACYNW